MLSRDHTAGKDGGVLLYDGHNTGVKLVLVRGTHLGCIKIPSYGVAGSKREFCFAHKRDGMVNVVTRRRAHHAGYTKKPGD